MIVNIVFVHLKSWELFVVSNLIKGMKYTYYENNVNTWSSNFLTANLFAF